MRFSYFYLYPSFLITYTYMHTHTHLNAHIRMHTYTLTCNVIDYNSVFLSPYFSPVTLLRSRFPPLSFFTISPSLFPTFTLFYFLSFSLSLSLSLSSFSISLFLAYLLLFILSFLLQFPPSLHYFPLLSSISLSLLSVL